jgi:hypothetical protein
LLYRHCEERSDEAIEMAPPQSGLLRFARNDALECSHKTATTTTGRRAFIRRRLIVVAVKAMGADCDAVHRQLQKHS